MKGKTILWVMMAALAWAMPLALPSQAQDPGMPGQPRVAAGQELKIEGVIVKRDADALTLRTDRDQEVLVTLTDLTEVKEKKANPFRRANVYGMTQLMRGLLVEVEGRGDGEGRIVARKIRFTQDELEVAQVVESRVTPVENQLKDANTRLAENEENARHMSGQVAELNTVSNEARSGAKAAQQSADEALEGVRQANTRIASNQAAVNSRITAIDEYEVMGNTVVYFKAGSTVLTPEAQEALDRFTGEAKNEKGYMIEITGFASSDGSDARNLELSRKRADKVIQYLVMKHQVPLRRIITPFGYGEALPVADNGTRPGRAQNRRVEAKLLVSKGLVEGGKAVSDIQER